MKPFITITTTTCSHESTSKLPTGKQLTCSSESWRGRSALPGASVCVCVCVPAAYSRDRV